MSTPPPPDATLPPSPKPGPRRARIWGALTLVSAAVVALAAVAASKPRSPFEHVGRTEHPWITECSGVAASLKQPGVLWVHNDSGNEPVIFAITAEGKTRGVFRISAENHDWEDIAIDGSGRIYIADVGNNEDDRRQIQIYRVAEPEVPTESVSPDQKPAPIRLRPDKTWRIKYASEPFNCEALVLTPTHGYLISKEPKKRKAQLFRFPLGEGAGEEKVTLEAVGELPIDHAVTGADLSPDGKRLAILSDGGLYVFSLTTAGDIASATAPGADPAFFETPKDNCEGVCFTPAGIVVTSEKGKIYRLSEPAPQ